MKFLNKKEQVIDLEITPYGKSLMAMGRFKPEYYAFFDNDVLYDSQYAGFPEHQNSASVRIKDALQLQTQAFFYSAEKQVKEATAWHRLTDEEKERAKRYGHRPVDSTNTPYVEDDSVTIRAIPDQEFEGTQLGNSAMNSSFAPAWNVNVIEGKIDSSSPTLTNLDLPIPQLNMTASMFKFTLSDTPRSSNFYEFGEGLSAFNPLQGKFLNVIGDSLIFEITEENTEYEWENFDIEIFEVEEVMFEGGKMVGEPTCSVLNPPCTWVSKEFLTPLFFMENVGQVQNGVLVDFDKLPASTTPTDARFAEYFFDINIDHQIEEDLLCGKAINKADGLFSQRTVRCDEKLEQEKINIERLYEGNDGECPPSGEDE